MSDRKTVEEATREAEKYAEAALDGKEYALFDYLDAFSLVFLAYLQGQRAGVAWAREIVS